MCDRKVINRVPTMGVRDCLQRTTRRAKACFAIKQLQDYLLKGSPADVFVA